MGGTITTTTLTENLGTVIEIDIETGASTPLYMWEGQNGQHPTQGSVLLIGRSDDATYVRMDIPGHKTGVFAFNGSAEPLWEAAGNARDTSTCRPTRAGFGCGGELNTFDGTIEAISSDPYAVTFAWGGYSVKHGDGNHTLHDYDGEEIGKTVVASDSDSLRLVRTADGEELSSAKDATYTVMDGYLVVTKEDASPIIPLPAADGE